MSENKIDDGGCAFPHSIDQNVSAFPEVVFGMSLRDWFAGMTICGALIAPRPDEGMVVSPDALARACYKYADAMIAEKRRTEKK